MDRVYIDTDIILDLLTERKPFYKPAAHLFSMIERKEAKGFVSPLIFANLFYILRKSGSSALAVSTLKKLKLLVTILPVDSKIIELSLSSGFTDFEDAIQYYTAIEHNISFLITRNKKDYKNPAITICTAEEYIALSRRWTG